MSLPQSNKSKLLRKYVSDNHSSVHAVTPGNLLLRDDEPAVDLSSESSCEEGPRRRVQSDDEKQPESITKTKAERKLAKKIRKSFGLRKDEDVDDFLGMIRLEGLDVAEYLRTHKGVKITREDVSTKKKKHRKAAEDRVPQSLLPHSYDKSSSDEDIPEQARTIFRNKDGTQRQHSLKQEKEIHQQQVMDRLAEWEGGMKHYSEREDVGEGEDMEHAKKKVWDDPLKEWEEGVARQPFECRYEGYANRFGIKPGHRWDGVVRGNGFENKLQAEENARKSEAHRLERQHLKHL